MQSNRKDRTTTTKANDPNFEKQNLTLMKIGEANTRLREQIDKELYADNIVQLSIQDKVGQVKNQAVKLAKQLQSQKRKNIQLEAIIKNMNYLREQSRKKQASFEDADDNLEALSKKINKLQHNLGQLNSKTNSLNSKTKTRKVQVDTYRTQRVIDSNIFDSLEIQLKDYSLNYKKLLIEKVKLQRQYDKCLTNYTKVKSQILANNDNFTNISSSKENIKRINNNINKEQQNFFFNAPQIEHAVKFTDISALQNNKRNRNNTVGSKRSLYNTSNTQYNPISQAKNQKYQFKLQKMLMGTGLSSAREILETLDSIEAINQNLYEQSNTENDKITELKNKLINIQAQISKKSVRYYNHQNHENETGNQESKKVSRAELIHRKCDKLKKNINNVVSTLDGQYQHINNLVKCAEFQQIHSLCLEDGNKKDKNPQFGGLDEFQNLFSKLQINIRPLINSSAQKRQQQLQLKLSESEVNDLSSSKAAYNSLNLKKLKQNENVSEGTARKHNNIDEIISKVKKVQQSEKVMEKQDFKRQYEQMRKNNGNNGSPVKNMRNTKKNTIMTKKSGHY